MLNPSLKSIIFTAPQGWGKTHHAGKLKAALGCRSVVDEWHPGQPVTDGALHLTNVPLGPVPEVRGDVDCTVINIGWLVDADEYFNSVAGPACTN